MFEAARQNFAGIADALRDAITWAAPSVRSGLEERRGGDRWVLRLGEATLRMTVAAATPADAWGSPRPAFDVIAHASLSLSIPANRYGYEGRSHSLWCSDPFQKDRFGWYETAFMFMPMSRRTSSVAPFALPPGPESGQALAPGIALVQPAWPLTRLAVGALDDFINRWAAWFASAYAGELNQPSQMPETTIEENWRSN